MAETTEDLNASILKELECPVCLEYIMPPVEVICVNGHCVCSGCSVRLAQCPTCRSRITKIKNVVLENIARKLQYFCTYRKWGCDKSLPFNLVKEHQESCFYVPRPCPFEYTKKCCWKGAIHTMRKHISDNHSQESIFVPDGEKAQLISHPDKSNEVEIAKVILTYKEMFLVRSGVRGDIFYCVVMHITTKIPDSSDFRYEFFCENTENKQTIAISNCVSSIGAKVEDIMDSGKCVLIPYAVIRNYIQPVFVIHLRYSIKISQSK